MDQSEQPVKPEFSSEEASAILARLKEEGVLKWLYMGASTCTAMLFLVPVTLVVLVLNVWRGSSAPYQRLCAAITIALGFLTVLLALVSYGMILRHSGGICFSPITFGVGKWQFNAAPNVLLGLLIVLTGSLGYAAFPTPWSYAFLIPIILIAYARLKLPFLFR